MSEALATLVAEVVLDSGPLRKSIAGLRGRLGGGIASIGRSLGTQFSQAFSVAVKGGIAAAVAGGLFSIKMAGEAAEIQSKFEAVFKELTAEAEQFAADFAKAIGRSAIDTKQQLASFQDTFVPLGFARDKASELSKELVGLTADLASFNNQSDSDVSEKLIGTLIGNHENARSWGVIITENTLNMKLMEMGIEGGTKAATEQQKVLARLAMITEGTTDAQGDAARTAGGFANQFKALRGAIKDTSVSIGQAFLPAATSIVASMREWAMSLEQHRQTFVEWGQALGEKVSTLIVDVREFIAVNKDMLLGIAAAIPKFIALAVAAKALAVAIGVVATALGTSSFATLLSPTGVLIVGIGALAAAFTHAKITGQGFSDSVAELTANLLGLENAVTAVNKAKKERDKTQQKVESFKGVQQQIDSQREAGTLSGKSLADLRAKLKEMRDKEMKHAQAMAKNAAGTEQAASADYSSALGKLMRGNTLGAAEDLYRSRGTLHNSQQRGEAARDAFGTVGSMDRVIRSISGELGTKQETEQAAAQAAEQVKAREAIDARDPFVVDSPAGQSSGGGWTGMVKGLGKQIASSAADAGKQALRKGKSFGERIKEGGVSAIGAIANGLKFEQDMRLAGTEKKPDSGVSGFVGLAEMSKNVQMSIGASKSPELATAKKTEDNTSKTNEWLQKILDQLAENERNNKPGVARAA